MIRRDPTLVLALTGVLIGCALIMAGTAASQNAGGYVDLRSPDARDASAPVDLRSPDARDVGRAPAPRSGAGSDGVDLLYPATGVTLVVGLLAITLMRRRSHQRREARLRAITG
jgi:hypothetical protein